MNFARNRQYLVLASCTLIALGLLLYWRPYQGSISEFTSTGGKRPLTSSVSQTAGGGIGTWTYPQDRDNLLLSQGQCEQAFPDLFVEIERARDVRSSNPITIEELDSIKPRNGYIRAMIYDQQVCQLSSINDPFDPHQSSDLPLKYAKKPNTKC